jgi:hypothetical protein
MGQRGRSRKAQQDEGGSPRHLGVWIVTVVLLAVLGTGGYFVYRTITNKLQSEQCTATGADGSQVTIVNDRMANAATIAAVARAKNLPEQATIIALATAQQESKIRNLDYGDRDSIGLFQQRPSVKEWGTAAQIADPVFASSSFFHALLNVPNWQSLDVGKAAQKVQRSADSSGESYAQWESMATVLATTLDGRSGTRLECSYDDPQLPAEAAGGNGLTPRAEAVGAALVKQFSANGVAAAPQYSHTPDGLTLRITAGKGTTDPRVLAVWAVASAKNLDVDKVAYADQVWTRSSGKWKTSSSPTSGTVDVTVVKGG